MSSPEDQAVLNETRGSFSPEALAGLGTAALASMFGRSAAAPAFRISRRRSSARSISTWSARRRRWTSSTTSPR